MSTDKKLFPPLAGGIPVRRIDRQPMERKTRQQQEFDALQRMLANGALRQSAPVAPPPRAPVPPPVEPAPKLVTQAEPKPGITRRKPTCKGDGLGKMPADWRARVFKATKNERSRPEPSGLRLAVAVLWCTGCRSEELQPKENWREGVEVEMRGGQLRITVRGAKVDEIKVGSDVYERGLDWHTLTIDPAMHEGAALLAEQAKDGPIVVSYNAGTLRTRLHEISHDLFGGRKDKYIVSANSFRHAMGSDLKSCDTITDSQRSKAMGHLSMTSLASYGRRRHKGGPSPFIEVEASEEPRGERQRGTPRHVQVEHQAAERQRG